MRYTVMMASNLKAVVRYDGGGFAGWQVQPGQRTVQGVIEHALGKIAGASIRIHASGRTDAGVHALAQVFSCTWPSDSPPERLRRSLSQMLSPEIRVDSIEEVAQEFHASYSAVSKTYVYAFTISREPDPFISRYAWALPWRIDRDRFAQMAQRLVGTHDFAGYCSSGSSAQTTERTILSAKVSDGAVISTPDSDNAWHIEFHGDGFLYKMVRNMVGTLADVARGNLPEERLLELLNGSAPYHGFTAPPQGLFLAKVFYDSPRHRT